MVVWLSNSTHLFSTSMYSVPDCIIRDCMMSVRESAAKPATPFFS